MSRELRLCLMPDCGAKAKARWMCASHYSTWVTRGRPAMPAPIGQRMEPGSVRDYAAPGQCTEPDCTTKARGRGLCSKHLKRQQRNGNPGTRQQTCSHDGHPWRTDGPGRPSKFCPEHRP